MSMFTIDNIYERLNLGIFKREVLDVRSKNLGCRLDALAWLQSVGYTSLINLALTIQSDQYARLLDKLQPPENEVGKRRDNHAT